MLGAYCIMLFYLAFVNILSLSLALPSLSTLAHQDQRKLTHTSHFARLKRLNHSDYPGNSGSQAYNTNTLAPGNRIQRVIEVEFNNIPRYLLLDTGSADTWMVSPQFQCLNASLKPVGSLKCMLGDPYTGPEILQVANETYYEAYGTGEIVYGKFGNAEVTVAGLTINKQKVATVERGYIIGDHIRSGLIGLAPRAVTSLFTSTNANTSAPDGHTTPYSTVFESMYSSAKQHDGKAAIKPVFSLALERDGGGGYISFGGLPPIDFKHDFAFAPFRGLDYYGHHDPGRYYPIQPDAYTLNGVSHATDYRVIIDSGTAINRLPHGIAEAVNALYDPPGVYDASAEVYITSCNASVPSFALSIGGKRFTMDPRDMFLSASYKGKCATSFTRGFSFGSKAYPEGFFVLGEAFLNGVVAVFDVGEGGMWFAPHDY